MGTHLHFDCFSGISGDMMLGALIDVGLPFAELVKGLNRLGVRGFRLRKRRVWRGAIHATKVDVLINRGLRSPLSLRRIHSILSASRLSDRVKRQSRSVFSRLADAEGEAHGVRPHRVHFHEVSVLDSFVDVVGTLIGCEVLDATHVTASALNVGSGTLQSAHGLLPVPGPAVAAMTKGIPVYSAGPARELATPTGVALLRELSSGYGSLPLMAPDAVGYGAGDADPDGWANVLRLYLARMPASRGRLTDKIVQIETNLDDVNPQAYEHIMERLFARGALDVTLTPVIMKRGRPGIVLSCLVSPEETHAVLDVLFDDTTALGVRVQEMARQLLPRRFATVRIPGGSVRVKVAGLDRDRTKAAPEYQDCKRIAERTGRPVKSVMEEAMVAYRRGLNGTKGRP